MRQQLPILAKREVLTHSFSVDILSSRELNGPSAWCIVVCHFEVLRSAVMSFLW